MLQIKLLDPDIIVCLGKFAAASIMGREFKGPLKQFFDNELLEFQLDGKTYKWLCTYHPSYLLRRPGEKRTVVPHWNLVKQWVAQKRR